MRLKGAEGLENRLSVECSNQAKLRAQKCLKAEFFLRTAFFIGYPGEKKHSKDGKRSKKKNVQPATPCAAPSETAAEIHCAISSSMFVCIDATTAVWLTQAERPSMARPKVGRPAAHTYEPEKPETN